MRSYHLILHYSTSRRRNLRPLTFASRCTAECNQSPPAAGYLPCFPSNSIVHRSLVDTLLARCISLSIICVYSGMVTTPHSSHRSRNPESGEDEDAPNCNARPHKRDEVLQVQIAIAGRCSYSSPGGTSPLSHICPLSSAMLEVRPVNGRVPVDAMPLFGGAIASSRTRKESTVRSESETGS